MKEIFQSDMAVGFLRNAQAVAWDFAMDVNKSEKWIKFENDRNTNSNGGNSFGSILDYREEWQSLEPLICAIQRFQEPSPKANPQSGNWFSLAGPLSYKKKLFHGSTREVKRLLSTLAS